MRLNLLDSTSQWEATSPAWDDLWQRSEDPSPLLRAASVGHWVRHFAPGTPVRALTVWAGDRMVAGLPLAEGRLPGGGRFGTSPNNAWSLCGELLVDPSADVHRLAAELAAGLRTLPWTVLIFRYVRIDSAPWRALQSAVRQCGGTAFAHPTHSVGQVSLPADLGTYLATRRKNHRRHLHKANRRWTEEGGGELRVLDSLQPGEVRAALRTAFEIEDRSWKGAAGSSVLRTPGMFDFMAGQAELLAGWRNLHLVFLAHQEVPIAFAYGMRAKQTFLTPKIGYDPAYARFSPGQLLFDHLLRRFASEPQPPVIDFSGPLADSTAQWATDTYSVGHVAISMRPIRGRAWIGAYRLLQAFKQRRRAQR